MDIILNGEVFSNGSTTIVFEYGKTTQYGNTITIKKRIKERKIIHSPIIKNLPVGLYHFRVTAKNKFGTTDGEDEIFCIFP